MIPNALPHWLLAVQTPPLRQRRAIWFPMQSGSQASPRLSPSVLVWVGLAWRTQLSSASTTPSPSRSVLSSHWALVVHARPRAVGGEVKASTQMPGAGHGVARPAFVEKSHGRPLFGPPLQVPDSSHRPDTVLQLFAAPQFGATAASPQKLAP